VSKRRVTGIAFAVAWGIAVISGMAWMMAFESAPGLPGDPPARWPAATRLAKANGGYTLVMAAHPRCPCTRASLAELAVVMAESQARLTAQVLFFTPEDATSDWWETDLWRTATAMPAVTPVVDRGGRLRDAFGAETSGSVAVYDAAGRLRFHGGLTAARGRTGVNDGRLSLISLIETGQAAEMTPVYGCPLRARTDVMADARRP
jgi:hypothetical protein